MATTLRRCSTWSRHRRFTLHVYTAVVYNTPGATHAGAKMDTPQVNTPDPNDPNQPKPKRIRYKWGETPKGAKYSNEQVGLALIAGKGFITFAAQALRVAPSTIERRLAKSPELRKIQAMCKREQIDTAALALHAQVTSGNIAAIIFTLKTLGKEDGFVERQEIAHTEPVTLRVVERVVRADPEGV